jgi:imidazolonepropionase-like amidohydrolase/ketosteroid isomerase-like protein
MKVVFSFALILSLISSVMAQTKSKPIAFTHVTVIDAAAGAAAQNDMIVIVTDEKIADIGKFGKVKIPKNSQVIDANGKFLIPGLWDMHVHLSKAGENALPLFIANGITSVRDMGGDYLEVLKWRKEAENGTRLSPRIKTPGALLESAENVARMKREGTVEPVEKYRIGIATPDEAQKAVALMASLSVDFIKFRTVFSPEVYQAIADESKARGLMFVGHQFDKPETMLAAEQKSIEHYIYPPIMTSPKRDEIYRKMVEDDIYVVPTIVNADNSLLVSYDDAKKIVEDRGGKIDFRRKYLSGYLIEDWKEQLEEKKQPSPVDLVKLKEVLLKDLREMHKVGVKIMPGTDVAVLLIYPGYSLHEELQFLVKYVGLTPMQAITSATRYPAEFFGMQNALGTIEKGKIADLVLLEANPLADVSNTKKISAVVQRGKIYTKTDLQKILSDVERNAQMENSRKGDFSDKFNALEVTELLRDVEERLAKAWVEGDRSFIEQILADDWSVTDLTGRILTKAEVLKEAFGSKDRQIVSMKIDDVKVRPFGDWAIVTGRTQAAGKYQGKTSEVTLRFTDVFAYRNGRWQVIASQATLLNQ